MRPAIASPRTNFDAPSIEPKNALSSSSSRRRACATFSGRKIGVDRHLLARNGVQGEAGADLGNAGRALGDYEKVDRHQDEEDDDADDEIAAHHQAGEAADDVACRGRTLLAAREDEAGGRNVEREPQDGRDEQHGREGRELERLVDPERDHQNEDRERDRERQPEVDHERRNGQEEEAEYEDDAGGEGDVLAAAMRAALRPPERAGPDLVEGGLG